MMPISENLKSKAYETIKNRIVDCTYAPGSMLNEETLQQELSISRTPIRDAIGRLEQEGLVTIKSKKGIIISDITFEEIDYIYEIRTMYEQHALLTYGNLLDKNMLASLYKACLDPLNIKDKEKAYLLDNQIHTSIMASVKNRYIVQGYQTIQLQNKRIRVISGNSSKERIATSTEEHKVILTACLESNWTKAADVMKVHLDNAKASIFAVLLQCNTLTTKKQ